MSASKRVELRWSTTFALLTGVLLLTELAIALYAHDRFVRPFVGDVLAVIVLYCLLATLVRVKPLVLATGVLLFSYTIEVLQAFDYVALLHLEHNRILSIAMGRTFQWSDFVAYTCGWAIVLGFDAWRRRTWASSPSCRRPAR